MTSPRHRFSGPVPRRPLPRAGQVVVITGHVDLIGQGHSAGLRVNFHESEHPAEFAALDSQPFEKQIEGLNKTAADPGKSLGEFKNLYRIYLTQNSDDLFNLTAKQGDGDAALIEKLLVERNAAWIPVIEKNIKVTPSFIGVGSAHLGGKKGVLNLLRRKGYKLTPIRL